MASFEPIILIFGCSSSIAEINIRLPVSISFVFDVKSLERLANVTPQINDACLSRFFIILLDSVDDELLNRLKTNHRVQAIYKSNKLDSPSQQQINRMTNSYRQLTLDVSHDIMCFLTSEGEKQIKLEQMSQVKIYYQQSRTLKQWMMSFFKAEPCHILLISLNSNQKNMDTAQERLQKLCANIGYTSTVIRQFNDYIPSNDRNSSILPYAELLFKNEDPRYICRLLKKLSPIRLYLYGNELDGLSEWSKLMISTEKNVMDDEDDWCAFLENEYVDNEIKWNFVFMFGREWKVSRVSPLNIDQLKENLRFHSALRRAHITFAERQVEVTADIFDWYEHCIKQKYLREEPILINQQKATKYNGFSEKPDLESLRRYPFQNLSSFDYYRFNSTKVKLVSFVWLDEILYDAEDQFQNIIKPFQWTFFDNLAACVSYLEMQLREQRYIFLITSGSLGNELFHAGLCSMNEMFAIYVYCAQLGSTLNWTRNYSCIRGVYNDSTKLANQIKRDCQNLQTLLNMQETENSVISKTTDEDQSSQFVETKSLSLLLPLPITVYNPKQAHIFMSHQRTIDTLLCMPHTLESKSEMLAEFRRIYQDDQEILGQIDNFEKNYHSNAAVQWYTRDSFVFRAINQALRVSNAESMFKLRYILTDIYDHLKESYVQMHRSFRIATPQIFYRGQLMSSEEFETFKTLRGCIISINTFLSTTASMQIALMYAGKYNESSDTVPVVFCIETNPETFVRPYANISLYSVFQDEEEVLFAMGSIFRIGNIRQLLNEDNIWSINLKTINQLHD